MISAVFPASSPPTLSQTEEGAHSQGLGLEFLDWYHSCEDPPACGGYYVAGLSVNFLPASSGKTFPISSKSKQVCGVIAGVLDKNESPVPIGRRGEAWVFGVLRALLPKGYAVVRMKHPDPYDIAIYTPESEKPIRVEVKTVRRLGALEKAFRVAKKGNADIVIVFDELAERTYVLHRGELRRLTRGLLLKKVRSCLT